MSSGAGGVTAIRLEVPVERVSDTVTRFATIGGPRTTVELGELVALVAPSSVVEAGAGTGTGVGVAMEVDAGAGGEVSVVVGVAISVGADDDAGAAVVSVAVSVGAGTGTDDDGAVAAGVAASGAASGGVPVTASAGASVVASVVATLSLLVSSSSARACGKKNDEKSLSGKRSEVGVVVGVVVADVEVAVVEVATGSETADDDDAASSVELATVPSPICQMKLMLTFVSSLEEGVLGGTNPPQKICVPEPLSIAEFSGVNGMPVACAVSGKPSAFAGFCQSPRQIAG